MSRFEDDDYDGEDFPNQAALWQANAERALKGKRGRRALRDLRAALLALPEPRLIAGALCTVNPAKRAEGRADPDWLLADIAEMGEGVCAGGAPLWHLKVKSGMDPIAAFDSLPTLEESNHSGWESADLIAHEAGLARPLAVEIAFRNDERFDDMSPEDRWTAFLAWINAELGDEAGVPS